MSGLSLDLNSLRLAVVLCLLATSASHAKGIDERDWIFAESQNFSIYSAQGERRTRELLEHLEALRNVFEVTAGYSIAAGYKPTRILATGSMTDYRATGAPKGSAGVFRDTLRENFIVIGKSLHMSEAQVILHEYVHFMIGSSSQISPPTWMEEGFAEYVSASELKSGHFTFGLALKGRLDYLRYGNWLDWEKVITATSSFGFNQAGAAAFYAQSWLLVHYLHNRGADYPGIWEGLPRYSQHLSQSNDPVAAFESAYNVTLDDLQQELRRYANRYRLSTYKFDREGMPRAEIETLRPVSKTEIRVLLGQYSLLREDSEKARHWFEQVHADDPNNPLATAGIGAALGLEEDYDEASDHYEIALNAAPDDPRILVDAALLDLERAGQSDAWFTSTDMLDSAEKRLLKARELTGGSTEIDTYLAYTWLSQDASSIPAVELLSLVVKRAPTERWPKLLLAESLLRAGYPEPAKALAQMVIRYDHGSGSYSTRARRLLDRIEDGDGAPDRVLPKIPEPVLPGRQLAESP